MRKGAPESRKDLRAMILLVLVYTNATANPRLFMKCTPEVRQYVKLFKEGVHFDAQWSAK